MIIVYNSIKYKELELLEMYLMWYRNRALNLHTDARRCNPPAAGWPLSWQQLEVFMCHEKYCSSASTLTSRSILVCFDLRAPQLTIQVVSLARSCIHCTNVFDKLIHRIFWNTVSWSIHIQLNHAGDLFFRKEK